jgi:hypothetical protein
VEPTNHLTIRTTRDTSRLTGANVSIGDASPMKRLDKLKGKEDPLSLTILTRIIESLTGPNTQARHAKSIGTRKRHTTS